LNSQNSAANAKAIERINSCHPLLRELVTASDALGLQQGELGHAGPPFAEGETVPVVVRNALAGAAVHEGWAGTLDEARGLLDRGEITLRSNHSLRTVSPMSGVVRPSQRLFRVEDRATGDSTFATLAEKGRHVLRFGFYNEAVGEQLHHLEGIVAEDIQRAIPDQGLPLIPLIANAVRFGDDVHQRNEGGMASFLAALPSLSSTTREWMSDHPQHFLNYGMAAAKLCLDQARGVAGSSVVTAISRNGVACGIQLAGLGDQWFTGPAEIPAGTIFPPFAAADAHPDLGDSAIMEAFGLGRSEAIAPALAGLLGVGVGLDVIRVVEAGIGVRIHTGIAHKDGTEGWIGVGVAHAPIDCFSKAAATLTRNQGVTG
jgi:hypothetical protein